MRAWCESSESFTPQTLTIKIETQEEWDTLWGIVADLQTDYVLCRTIRNQIAYAMRNRETKP